MHSIPRLPKNVVLGRRTINLCSRLLFYQNLKFINRLLMSVFILVSGRWNSI